MDVNLQRARAVSVIAGAMAIFFITLIFLFVVARMRSRGATIKAELNNPSPARPPPPATEDDATPKYIIDEEERRLKEQLKRENDETMLLVIIGFMAFLVVLVAVVYLLNAGESVRRDGLQYVGETLHLRPPYDAYASSGERFAPAAPIDPVSTDPHPPNPVHMVNSAVGGNDQAFQGVPPRPPTATMNTNALQTTTTEQPFPNLHNKVATPRTPSPVVSPPSFEGTASTENPAPPTRTPSPNLSSPTNTFKKEFERKVRAEVARMEVGFYNKNKKFTHLGNTRGYFNRTRADKVAREKILAETESPGPQVGWFF